MPYLLSVLTRTSRMTITHFCRGALPTHPGLGGEYRCMACALPQQRACECTHGNYFERWRKAPQPCARGVTHWCLFEPEYVAKEEDGLFWCRHNSSNTGEEAECGLVGHEACLTVPTGYWCISPLEDGELVAALPRKTSMTATVYCERCGRANQRACPCHNGGAAGEHQCDASIGFWCHNGAAYDAGNGLYYCPHTTPAVSATDLAQADTIGADIDVHSLQPPTLQ